MSVRPPITVFSLPTCPPTHSSNPSFVSSLLPTHPFTHPFYPSLPPSHLPTCSSFPSSLLTYPSIIHPPSQSSPFLPSPFPSPQSSSYFPLHLLRNSTTRIEPFYGPCHHCEDSCFGCARCIRVGRSASGRHTISHPCTLIISWSDSCRQQYFICAHEDEREMVLCLPRDTGITRGLSKIGFIFWSHFRVTVRLNGRQKTPRDPLPLHTNSLPHSQKSRSRVVHLLQWMNPH